jgi:hypothetical protein
MRRVFNFCVALSIVFTGVPTKAGGLNVWPVNSAETENSAWSESSNVLIARGNDCACNDCGAGCKDDCCCVGGWRDNTEVFFGGDAYASIGDFPAGGYGNSFGLVSGFNTGFGIGDSEIRGQIGASYGFYDFKGRGFGAEVDSLEEQVYLTTGIYRRADLDYGERFTWGMVVDGLVTDNWGANANELDLAQFRGIGGVALNDCNEVGLWGTLNLSDDTAVITGRGTPSVRAMKQTNAYWKHNTQFGGETMVYVGAMDTADVGDWVFGLTGRAPLSCNTGLYGGFNYVTPSVNTGIVGDTEDSWNVNFGIVIYLGGKSESPNVAGNAGLPLLPVANNGSFLITD